MRTTEQKLREAMRSGDTETYWEMHRHAGLFHSSDAKLGPPSILEAKCATPDCSHTLKWSNCSFCAGCHTDNSDCIGVGGAGTWDEDAIPYELAGVVLTICSDGKKVKPFISSCQERSCNLKGLLSD